MKENKDFTYFRNHGDEDGRNSFTICYAGRDEDGDYDFDEGCIIVAAADTEVDAIESCKRLNAIQKDPSKPAAQPEGYIGDRINKEMEGYKVYNHPARKIFDNVCWRLYGQTFDTLCSNNGTQSGFWLDIILPAMQQYAKEQVAAQPAITEQQDSGLVLAVNSFHEWQKVTFPNATPISKLKHLEQEVVELIVELSDNTDDEKVKSEYADCFALLFGSAMANGYTIQDIADLLLNKLEVNKCRKWGRPDANGVVNHIKGELLLQPTQPLPAQGEDNTHNK